MTRSLVPSYIEELKIYQAGKPIEELAREKDLTQISKIASNENPLGPSPMAMREMTTALWDVHRYPDMHAHDLKVALSKLYNLTTDNIVLGNGSEGIMGYIMRAFLKPGDEVVTSKSTFIGFEILAKAAGTKLIQCDRTFDYRYDIKKLKEKISESTRLVYIANPDNPTGTYITTKEFDSLMESIPKHCIVIVDEAYFEFANQNKNYPNSMNYRYDNVITLRTFSKAYGICGIRIGYGLAHSEFIKNLTKIKLPFEPNSIAQKGAIGALKDRFHLKDTLSNNTKRYNETISFFKKHNINFIPSVTNFVTFETGSIEASKWLYQSLLNLGVIIRPLFSNGLDSFMRVSLGKSQEMQHFFDSMEKVLPEFNKLYKKVN